MFRPKQMNAPIVTSVQFPSKRALVHPNCASGRRNTNSGAARPLARIQAPVVWAVLGAISSERRLPMAPRVFSIDSAGPY